MFFSEQTLQFLTQHPLFSNLSDALCEYLAEELSINHYKAGQFITKSSPYFPKFRIIRSGVVKISQSVYPGKSKTIDLLKAKDFFGEMIFINHCPLDVNFSFYAYTDTLIFSFSGDFFNCFIKKYSSVRMSLNEGVGHKLFLLHHLVANTNFRSLEQKISGLLLYLSYKFGINQNNQSTKINLKITHRLIGEFCDSARESVTKSISRLQKLNLISYHDRHLICIPNLTELKKFVFE